MARHANPTDPRIFHVQVDDLVIGEQVTSAPQCRLTHNLNNYRGVVIGHRELLAEYASNDARVARHLWAILEAARKMADLIRGSACGVMHLGLLSTIPKGGT